MRMKCQFTEQVSIMSTEPNEFKSPHSKLNWTMLVLFRFGFSVGTKLKLCIQSSVLMQENCRSCRRNSEHTPFFLKICTTSSRPQDKRAFFSDLKVGIDKNLPHLGQVNTQTPDLSSCPIEHGAHTHRQSTVTYPRDRLATFRYIPTAV